MKYKRILSAAAVTLLLTAATVGSAFAADAPLSLCNVDNCDRTANHSHYGTSYAGHYYDDGHDYHSHDGNNGGHGGGHGHGSHRGSGQGRGCHN